MAAITLTRTATMVAGTVGNQRVELLLDVPDSRAGVRGHSLGADVAGYWRIESNYDNLDPVGLFLGEYDSSPVYLRNEVHLTPHYSLTHADITGTIGDRELTARVAPVEAPAYGPSALSVDGRFNTDTITLFASIAGDLSRVRIDGAIGGRTVTITATGTSVTGEYQGPPELFPLLVGSLLYFS